MREIKTVIENGVEYSIDIAPNGVIRYYKKGTTKLHRLNGPAISWPDGRCDYYLDGIFAVNVAVFENMKRMWLKPDHKEWNNYCELYFL